MKNQKKIKTRGFWQKGRPKKGSLRYILAEIEEILNKDKKNP